MSDVESRLSALEQQVAELMKDKFLASFPKRCKDAFDAYRLEESIDDIEPGYYCRNCISEHGRLTKLPVEREDIPGGLRGGLQITCPKCHHKLHVQ